MVDVDVGAIGESPTGPTYLGFRRPRSLAERCYRPSRLRARCSAVRSPRVSTQSHRRFVMSALMRIAGERNLRCGCTFGDGLVKPMARQSGRHAREVVGCPLRQARPS